MTPMMFSAKLKCGNEDKRSHMHLRLTEARGDLPERAGLVSKDRRTDLSRCEKTDV